MSLIQPDDHLALWAVLLGGAALGMWAERTPWGRRVTGYVFCIFGAVALSNLHIIPTDAPAYDVAWSYLVPLSIPLLLFKADLRRVLRESGPTLIGFVAGAVGTTLGVAIAWIVVPLGPDGWKMAASFCSTYIGGSMNYVAAAEVTGFRSSDLLAAGVAADNLLTTFFLLLLFALPGLAIMRRWFPEREPAAVSTDTSGLLEDRPFDVIGLASSLAVAAVIVAVGYGIAELLSRRWGLSGWGILVSTALVIAMATAFPRTMQRLQGGEAIGTWMMHVFFVALGASADIAKVVHAGFTLFWFAGVVLTVHLAFSLLVGRLFKLDIREIVIASNANIGGPATAVALAVARRWEGLIIPAVLTGTLGYALGTFIGVAVGTWLRG